MDRDTAIATMREALGKGADAVLAAAAQCMEYGPRNCTYAELAGAYAAASGKQDAPAAWVSARAEADAALRGLAEWRKPAGEGYRTEQCRFGVPPTEPSAENAQGGSVELVAFLPLRLQAPGAGLARQRWHAVALDPHSTLDYWLHAVAQGYQGRFPWGPLVRWHLDSCPPRIHERRATVTAAGGRGEVIRRPRLASQATTGRWTGRVLAGEIDGEMAAVRTQLHRGELRICRPVPPPAQGRLFALPMPARDERLSMVVALDRHNPVLRGDTSLLLDVAHMADRAVRGTVREWAGLLARSRDGGFRRPLSTDCRRVWDAALAARSMHLRERDAQGRATGRWAPLVHVDGGMASRLPRGPRPRRTHHRPRPLAARGNAECGRMDADSRRRSTGHGPAHHGRAVDGGPHSDRAGILSVRVLRRDAWPCAVPDS